MGGPSYQTPYPVSDTKGGQVIWDWGTKAWGPYDAAAAKAKADATPKAGTPDASGEGGSSAPSMSGTADTNTGGSEQYQVPKGSAPKARRRTTATSLPGQSLLMGGNY
jgi:hypothetical protein